jgi:hypothetical protein
MCHIFSFPRKSRVLFRTWCMLVHGSFALVARSVFVRRHRAMSCVSACHSAHCYTVSRIVNSPRLESLMLTILLI